MNTTENAALEENSRSNEANEMDDNYGAYSNSDSSSSEYEWVYYDVQECKSDCSSSENDMYANEINQKGNYEYYDEVTASASEDENENEYGENGGYQY